MELTETQGAGLDPVMVTISDATNVERSGDFECRERAVPGWLDREE